MLILLMDFIKKHKIISIKILLILDLLNKEMLNHLSENQPVKLFITQAVEVILNICKSILM